MQGKDYSSLFKSKPLHPNPHLAAIGCSITFDSRFWAKVRKTDDCWLWTAFTTYGGYGAIKAGSENSATIPAHVASWIMHNGPIPSGLCVCHNCPGGDNPSCVNPAHLWLGTRADNAHDMKAKQRSAHGENASRSKLKWQQVCTIRDAWNSGTFTQRELARRYSVHYTCIFKIVHDLLWKPSRVH